MPAKCTVPDVTGRSPVRQLKKVDLPAPLGPIRPSMSPSSTDTDASSPALKAPKALVTLFALISMAAHGLALRRPALEQGQKPARQEARDDHDDGAIATEKEARTPP